MELKILNIDTNVQHTQVTLALSYFDYFHELQKFDKNIKIKFLFYTLILYHSSV